MAEARPPSAISSSPGLSGCLLARFDLILARPGAIFATKTPRDPVERPGASILSLPARCQGLRLREDVSESKDSRGVGSRRRRRGEIPPSGRD